jgi:ubiquinone/menaquinone biosynthesis C-methylase UbiE
MKQFDYEAKTWGGTKVRLSPFYLGASRLESALVDLKNIQGRVLEVGCGAGGMVKAIKFYRPDLQVLGIDISKGAIAEAKQDPQGVKFSVADANQLPFKNNSLEAVLMFDLLEHLDDPLKALDEVWRVLKPKGIFSAFVPIEGEIFSLHGLVKKLFNFIPKEKYGGHIQQYTLSELRSLLKKAKLKILKKQYSGHFFYQLVDFSYFSYLFCRGKNVAYSVEGYLAQQKGLKRNFIALVKSIVALISYLESKIFWFLPASGACLTATKTTKGLVE